MIYILPLLSVVLGYIAALILKPTNKKSIKLLLAFSGSFLLSLTVMHLLPEVYESSMHGHEGHVHEHTNNPIGLYIMAGIIFQIILEYFSKGAEHGHVHGQGHEHSNSMPWLLFISLCIHALLEGMPVSHHHDLAWGIAIHHFPIAIILTAFFVNSGLNKTAILLFIMAFAVMTPLGTLLSGQLAFIGNYYTEISAIVVGILFHISSTIIFESSEGHKFNMAKLLAIILGVIMAYFL
ncbi:ZIP family metal transporter [Flavobacterium arcticum]|uniref:ZIP family metal transporter n=1 Tax=Flavobacterium arcticum TaxID=1784713 RepID=A0A345HFD4_9FLAO|nr:ZIP family metal transporter [Flavobacterium arcticum]AXG75294.1 ZIP family metal transporter [Flavobacterium arcticum]KAF2509820.1 ZIP family metal transporter [Flavobacterium arcticum]